MPFSIVDFCIFTMRISLWTKFCNVCSIIVGEFVNAYNPVFIHSLVVRAYMHLKTISQGHSTRASPHSNISKLRISLASEGRAEFLLIPGGSGIPSYGPAVCTSPVEFVIKKS